MSDMNKRRMYDANAGTGTLISEDCKIKGEISGKGNFMINGEFDGECDIEGTVTVAKDGCWRGTLKANSVIVTGTLDGEIHALGSVEIGETARISGSICGESIAVAEGAIVEGVMQTTGQDQPTEFVEKRHPDEVDE